MCCDKCKQKLTSDVDSGIVGIGASEISISHDIVFNNRRFQPKDDITPMESVRISQLFTNLLVTAGFGGGTYSFDSFIETYKLERHFELMEE